jgi:hypothetical protein
VLATAVEANPALGKLVREVYDELIDFGAHPNVTGVFKNFRITDQPEGSRLDMAYLHGETAEKYESLTAGIEVAVYAMALLLAGFREDAKDLGLLSEVQALIDLGQRRMERTKSTNPV